MNEYETKQKYRILPTESVIPLNEAGQDALPETKITGLGKWPDGDHGRKRGSTGGHKNAGIAANLETWKHLGSKSKERLREKQVVCVGMLKLIGWAKRVSSAHPKRRHWRYVTDDVKPHANEC